MYLCQTNHKMIATHGVGSGNAPALAFCSVGHLRVAFYKILKAKSYEQFKCLC